MSTGPLATENCFCLFFKMHQKGDISKCWEMDTSEINMYAIHVHTAVCSYVYIGYTTRTYADRYFLESQRHRKRSMEVMFGLHDCVELTGELTGELNQSALFRSWPFPPHWKTQVSGVRHAVSLSPRPSGHLFFVCHLCNLLG